MMSKKTTGVRVYTQPELDQLIAEARQQAWREGHAEGYERGYCDGSDDAHEEIGTQLARAGVGQDPEYEDSRLVAFEAALHRA